MKKTAVAPSYSPKLSLEEMGELFVLSQSSYTCLSCFLILNEKKKIVNLTPLGLKSKPLALGKATGVLLLFPH